MDYTTAINLQAELEKSGHTCELVNTNFSPININESIRLYPNSFGVAVKSDNLHGVKKVVKRYSSASFSFYFFEPEVWDGYAFAGHIKIS